MTILTRKAHVKRCFGVIRGSDGVMEDDFDSYIDILRIDEFQYKLSDHGQDYRFLIKWADADLKEDAEDYDNLSGIKDRKTELGKGTDPELPFEKDPTSYIPFRVINEITIKDSDIGQDIRYIFKNKNRTPEGAGIPTTREIDTIRLYHWDTTLDDQLNDENGTHIVDVDDYMGVLKEGTKDKDQYVDMEVMKFWIHRNAGTDKDHIDGQEIKQYMRNAEMYETLIGIDIKSEISPGTNSAGEETIAARMDPFQLILNVQWGNLAVEFLDKDK